MVRRNDSKFRDERSLRRIEGRRATEPVVLIACEGHTERQYFEAIRVAHKLRTVQIPADAAGLDPSGLVAYVEKRARDEGGFDHIICAFDRDSHAHFEAARARIRELARGAKRLPITEAVTVPAIEFWFLLHFERTSRPFRNSAEVIAYIQAQGHIENYEKADAALCRGLVDRTEAAVANATWLRERALRDGFDNPFTNVHEIVTLLQSLRRS